MAKWSAFQAVNMGSSPITRIIIFIKKTKHAISSSSVGRANDC